MGLLNATLRVTGAARGTDSPARIVSVVGPVAAAPVKTTLYCAFSVNVKSPSKNR